VYNLNSYSSAINNILIIILILVIYTIRMYNNKYRTILVFLLLWALLSVSNIIYFYLLIETSILYFIYLFSYSAYKERTRSLILIIIYILIFRLPFLVLTLNIQTNIHLIKVTCTNWAMFALLIIIFVIKIPLFGLHYWLLKAHSYCTTLGRVILARIILKVGVLGFIYIYQIRYVNLMYAKYFVWIGVLISSLNMLFLTDIKMIIAQTRVTHISFLCISLSISNNIRIKLNIMFCYIHGLVRSIIFRFAEILMVSNKSRNIILLKQLYVIRLIFIVIMLINNSFPATPYMWCELWIFIIISRNMIRYIPIVIVIVIACNILFFNWLTMLKYQYMVIISDLKYVYATTQLMFRLLLFIILIK